MKSPKRVLRSIVYTIPGAQRFWVRANHAFGRGGRTAFSGWGMFTEALPPWHDGDGDRLAREFARVNEDVIAGVAGGRFNLSQFNDVQDKSARLRELMWRHYIVFWSARYAVRATRTSAATLVECGVCDGLTAYFAMNAVGGGPFAAYLFDAWEGMKAEYLLESERAATGSYSYLSVENAKRNLSRFQREAVFVKGYIPESFAATVLPAQVDWLHIDLNASLPTTTALDALFDRIPAGGVVLFDDYAWAGFRDTKIAVDTFFQDKQGLLLPLPTGQALFLKH